MTSSPTRPAVDTSSTFSDLCKKCFFIQSGRSLQPLQRHTSLKLFYEPQPWSRIFCIQSAILATSRYATICFNFFRNQNLKKVKNLGGGNLQDKRANWRIKDCNIKHFHGGFDAIARSTSNHTLQRAQSHVWKLSAIRGMMMLVMIMSMMVVIMVMMMMTMVSPPFSKLSAVLLRTYSLNDCIALLLRNWYSSQKH